MTARVFRHLRFGALIVFIASYFAPTLLAIIFLAVIVPSSGDGQTGAPSTSLPQPLVVKVFRYDANGNPTIPASGVVVFFGVSSPAGASGAFLSNTDALTDGDGMASTQLTLGNRVGQYQVTVTCALPCASTPITFNETAAAVQPITIALSISPASIAPSGGPNGNFGDAPHHVTAQVTVTSGALPDGTPITVMARPFDLAAAGHDHFNVNCSGCLPSTTAEFVDFRGPVTPIACVVTGGTCTSSLGVPLVSGLYTVSAMAPGGTASNEVVLPVEVPGINLLSDSILTASPNLTLTGQFGSARCGNPLTFVESRHSANHYGADRLLQDLIAIGEKFAELHPGYKIRINDISLISGGLFDIGNNWSSSPDGHASHRFGYNADIEFHADTASGCVDLDHTQIADLKKAIKDATNQEPVCEGPSGVVHCETTEDRYHLNNR